MAGITNPNSGLGITDNKDYSAPSGVEQDPKYSDVTKAKGAELKEEIGRSGVLIMNGFIIGEEYNKDLVGRPGSKKFDEMRRSSAPIKAALQAVKLPILAASYDFTPPPEDPKTVGQKKVEFLRAQIIKNKTLNFKKTLREILTHLEFGFAVFEKTFEMTTFGGSEFIGIKKFAFRKQYSIYRWMMGNGQAGIQQWLMNGGFKDIPDWKLALFTNEQEGDNYAGMSILRPVYKDWFMLDLFIKLNAMAHERYGVGIPVAKQSADSTTAVAPDEWEKLRESLRNMRSNEEAYLEIPGGIDLEIMKMASNTSSDMLPSIEFHNKQIFLNVLAQFLMLGQGASGGGGSRALSEDSSQLFLHSLEYVADYVCATLTENLAKDLIELNWGQGAAVPEMTHEKIGDDNIQLFSEAILKLTQAGVITSTLETEKYFRKMLGMPELSKEEEAEWTKPEPKPVAPAQPADEGKSDKTAAEVIDSVKRMSNKITSIIGE